MPLSVAPISQQPQFSFWEIRIFRTIFSIAILLSTLSLFAKTEFSQTVEYVQKRYANQFTDYPILIFDKDEIHFRFAAANLFGDKNEAKRVEIIKSYVLDESGVVLTDSDAASLDIYLTKLKEGAFAVPVTRGSFRAPEYQMCAVFPALYNSNQRLEAERITGLTIPGAYQDIDFNHLKRGMTLKEMRLFSIYHELGHCLDRKYMPAASSEYELDAYSIHLSESFAEVMGLLLLEREGITNTAAKRALYRNLYSRKVGKWMADNPQYGVGNQAFQYGGITYYLVPVLKAAQKIIESGEVDFTSLSLEQINTETVKVVDAHALKSRSFAAIFQFMNRGETEARAKYHRWAEEMPDLFTETLGELISYINTSTAMLDELLDLNVQPEKDGTDELSSLDNPTLCDDLKEGRQSLLETFLQSARNELEQSRVSIEMQRERQIRLNDFFNNLSSSCAVKS
ncbi:MAG: hypothetical protein HN623_12060 [Bdellovibrionales bacterium]|nr:hypothetical protein [Bdellovibrionales bacterium]